MHYASVLRETGLWVWILTTKDKHEAFKLEKSSVVEAPSILLNCCSFQGSGTRTTLSPWVSKSFKNSREWEKTYRTIWRCMCSMHAPNRFRCSLLCVGGINLGSVFSGFSFGRALQPPIILKQEGLREAMIRWLTPT